MLVSCEQMQQCEERAFGAGVSAGELMEQAGNGIASCIHQFYPHPGTAILYLGRGNNAGDAIVAGRELLKSGWKLSARLSGCVEAFRELPLRHWKNLSGQIAVAENPFTPEAAPKGPLILLDGLLGIGARGPMNDSIKELAREMNALRSDAHADIVAMDMPSGLDGDTGLPYPDAVRADLTVTVGQVKAGLLGDAAINHVGRLARVPLEALHSCDGDASAVLLTPELLRSWFPRRDFDCYKGIAGRLLIIAGSPGFTGAAELACLGALHGGAGLVTLLAKPETYLLLASRVPAEVMVKSVADFSDLPNVSHDAIILGPGLGRNHDDAVLDLYREHPTPIVVDADALNALAEHGLPVSSQERLLTPHVGEWRRLAPELASSGHSRRQQVEAFCAGHPNVCLLLKGARTIIHRAGHSLGFNSTGHPGMASGGMGDLLSGVIGAQIAAGVPMQQAAALGSWLCGRAAERAALCSHPHAVLPSHVAVQLGGAMHDLTNGCF